MHSPSQTSTPSASAASILWSKVLAAAFCIVSMCRLQLGGALSWLVSTQYGTVSTTWLLSQPLTPWQMAGMLCVVRASVRSVLHK